MRFGNAKSIWTEIFAPMNSLSGIWKSVWKHDEGEKNKEWKKWDPFFLELMSHHVLTHEIYKWYALCVLRVIAMCVRLFIYIFILYLEYYKRKFHNTFLRSICCCCSKMLNARSEFWWCFSFVSVRSWDSLFVETLKQDQTCNVRTKIRYS